MKTLSLFTKDLLLLKAAGGNNNFPESYRGGAVGWWPRLILNWTLPSLLSSQSIPTLSSLYPPWKSAFCQNYMVNFCSKAGVEEVHRKSTCFLQPINPDISKLTGYFCMHISWKSGAEKIMNKNRLKDNSLVICGIIWRRGWSLDLTISHQQKKVFPTKFTHGPNQNGRLDLISFQLLHVDI